MLIFLRRSGFSSRCPCRLPALGLSLVSALLQPRGVGKTPSQHGTASATTSLVPGRVRAARGGGPRAASHPAELRSPRGFPAGSVPLCHIPLASPSCLPAEVVGSDGYPRMTTSLSSPVQLQGLVWQPLCPSHMARGVSGHPGQGRTWGGRVRVLWGCPAPLPTAMCCWQAQAQPRWFSAAPRSPSHPGAALISPPCQAQPGKSSPGRCHHSQDGTDSKLLPPTAPEVSVGGRATPPTGCVRACVHVLARRRGFVSSLNLAGVGKDDWAALVQTTGQSVLLSCLLLTAEPLALASAGSDLPFCI